MTLLFVEGFDHQNTSTDLATGDDWTSASVAISAAAARFLGKGIICNGFQSIDLAKNFPASHTQGIIGFAILLPVAGAGRYGYWRFHDSAGNIQFTMDFNTNVSGQIQIMQGDRGTVIGTSGSNNLTQGTWGYVELQWNITSGAVVLRLNGNQVFSGTGNLNPNSTGNWQQISYVNDANGMQFDDMYLLDPSTGSAPNNAFLGAANGVQVETLFPTANQGAQQFTPLANANWQEVSETAMDSNTSYNSSASLGNQDLFDIGSLSSNPVAVFAVAVRSACERDSTTNPIKIKNRLVSSATESDGATITQGTSYAYQTDIYETDPHTATQWTGAGVNAAQIGYNLAGVS